MNRLRTVIWTGLIAGALLVSPGSGLADSGHVRHRAFYKNHPLKLAKVRDNHFVKRYKHLKHGRNYVWIEGHYVRRNGRYVWRKGHWAVPRRHGAVWVPGHWKRAHRRSVWVPGHWRLNPRRVVLEPEATEENEGPLIQIGPEELSVTISLP